MSDEAHYHQDITHSSQQRSPLWLLMMSLNLFFTGIGAAIRDGPCEFTNQSHHDYSGGKAVYGTSIVLYLILGLCCLVINQFDRNQAKMRQECTKLLILIKACVSNKTKMRQECTKLWRLIKACVSNKTKMCQECTKLRRLIDWWKVLRDTLVLMAGCLYLASDNLALVAQLGDRLNENTYLTYEDLRSVLLGASLILGLVPKSVEAFSEGLINKEGVKKPELVGLWDMTTNRLFPMLMYTVQADQIYTAIVGEVVHHAKEMKDGTKCPKANVITGILFFVAVSIIWIGVVSGVIIKHIYQLHRFEKDNSNRRSPSIRKHISMLVISWPILALYTPTYIALDNRWPWICAAKCQVQEECIESKMAPCDYVRARIVLLFLLWGFTVCSVFFYFISRYAAICREGINTIFSQLGESLRSLQSNHEERAQQVQLHESAQTGQPVNHNERTQQGHITDQPNYEEETQP